jgi:hypothetical protein
VNREVRDEWVRRLRSGEYTQGLLTLYRSSLNEYCCLGVLCEVAREAGVVERSVDGYRVDALGAWYNGVLPPAVAEWAGLDDVDPVIRGVPLVYYNDGHGDVRRHDFTEIARLIEENL